jgi:hypothetical protein
MVFFCEVQMAVLWVIAPCNLVEVYRRFRVLVPSIISVTRLRDTNNPEDSHLHTRRRENLKSHGFCANCRGIIPFQSCSISRGTCRQSDKNFVLFFGLEEDIVSTPRPQTTEQGNLAISTSQLELLQDKI